MNEKPSQQWIYVTPEMAERWLGLNRANRNVRQNVVDAYARDMSDGNWEMTGEPIKFAHDGRLLDGQHRLHAVIKSGVTVLMLVVRGLPSRSQLVMDSGARRTAADALHMDGRAHTTFLSAGARVAIALRRGQINNANAARITHAEIRTFVDATPGFVEAVDSYCHYAHQIPAPKGVIAYVAWRLSLVDSADAKTFIESVATQEMLRSTDPRMVLAKRLSAIREHRTKETPDAYIAMFFHAWNSWRTGSTRVILKIFRPVQIPTPK